jgi:hypothetical protein
MILKMTKKDTAYSLYMECKKLFSVWCYSEAELKKITSERKGDYEIEFPNNIEADEDLANLSANDLDNKGIIGITLEECLKMEIEYFKKIKGHLNIQNVTLCSGSRFSDGLVPIVVWHDYRLYVDWCPPDDAGGILRSRQPVSKLGAACPLK